MKLLLFNFSAAVILACLFPLSLQAGADSKPNIIVILAGGGFKGGYVYGKTSKGAEEVDENPVTIPDFNATIAYALGIPIKKELFSPTGRPFTVAHKGEPVLELFA